jgi:hypothetical protein
MRATRDLLHRPIHLMRQRAELLAHVQNTNSQDHLPEFGKKIAYKANQDGIAERIADPAVPKSIEVDLALLTSDDERLTALELSLLKAATHHDATTLYVSSPHPHWPTPSRQRNLPVRCIAK